MSHDKRQRHTNSAFVVAITGSSCSGKTTLSQQLLERLRADGLAVEIVEQDRFRQKSSDNTLRDGRKTWEGPQFTSWAKLHGAVAAASVRSAVVLVEGYMVLDCADYRPDLAALVEGVLWVHSTKEQARRERLTPGRQPACPWR